jgi:hypothetical protein
MAMSPARIGTKNNCGGEGQQQVTRPNQHATIEELLEAVISVRSVARLYSKNQREKLISLVSVCMCVCTRAPERAN